VLRVARAEQDLTELPIVTNVDLGHTDPIWTVPQGVPLRVDPEARELTFLEAPVT
jgi:muramoyltetrapeptide carboxypeptidase LdcA involved in peptidoglycan recycling